MMGMKKIDIAAIKAARRADVLCDPSRILRASLGAQGLGQPTNFRKWR